MVGVRQRGGQDQVAGVSSIADVATSCARHTFAPRISAGTVSDRHKSPRRKLAESAWKLKVAKIHLVRLYIYPGGPPVPRGCNTTLMLHMDRTHGGSSSILNSIPLASGDDGDLGHYCAEIITLGLCVLSARGPSSCVPSV